VPLSQEHRHELAQARRLLRAASAEPEERLAVASAYIDAFFAETVEHFRREEGILFPLYRHEPPHRRPRQNGLFAIRSSWIPVAVRIRADRE
jgi:iron-sulfur cluster repair protein YtfE (RIC family)